MDSIQLMDIARSMIPTVWIILDHPTPKFVKLVGETMFSVVMERAVLEKNQDAYIMREFALPAKNHSLIIQKQRNVKSKAV